jgi:hypothetical protein
MSVSKREAAALLLFDGGVWGQRAILGPQDYPHPQCLPSLGSGAKQAKPLECAR